MGRAQDGDLGMNDAGPTSLVRYDEMCRAIDAAYEVDEVKHIRDQAIAWEVYSRQAKNFEAEMRACHIRLRAERQAGRILKQKEKAKGTRFEGREADGSPRRSHDVTTEKTLADLGISKGQSSRWQRLADVPEDQFEAALPGPDMPRSFALLASGRSTTSSRSAAGSSTPRRGAATGGGTLG